VTGSLGPSFRFLSPLIEPDVRISRIRLSGWLHGKAHGSEGRMHRDSECTPKLTEHGPAGEQSRTAAFELMPARQEAADALASMVAGGTVSGLP
jgi:hypothetical protein